ncbi:MAG: D-tyrosyl-tRNA(Tyr) deacylase [Erysipelotrichales bacterium]|nr:MAG: D-tyrosyl-tRNA(Tyr) deacylase [Erysipelotrichales bacterium]
MRAVLQRVVDAKVEVDNTIVGKIGRGMVVYVGVGVDDTIDDAMKLAYKIANARVFYDENGKMNLSVQDIKGSVLSISQFTLYGDTSQGHRPSYIKAARPELANRLYEAFNTKLRTFIPVETGTFQMHMTIYQTNDGPVTVMYETKEKSV